MESVNLNLQIITILLVALRWQHDRARLYSEREACALLGVSRHTLIRRRKSGELGYVLDDGVVRYTRQQLEDYVNSKTVEVKAKRDTRRGLRLAS